MLITMLYWISYDVQILVRFLLIEMIDTKDMQRPKSGIWILHQLCYNYARR